MRWVITGSVSGSWSDWAKADVQKALIINRRTAFFFMEMYFNAPKIRKNHDSQHWLQVVVGFLCDVGRFIPVPSWL